jgi:hypothetical protein
VPEEYTTENADDQIAQLIQQSLQNVQQQDQQFMNYGMQKARSNLFFDDDSMIEYLASEKFPNDPSASLRYQYQGGELVYQDYDGNYKKVFAPGQDVGWFEEYVFPNIVPTTTFASDVGGGIAGAGAGFRKGLDLTKGMTNPWAKAATIAVMTGIGGFGGNVAFGAPARAGREAMINMFYNAPPEELSAAFQDLMVSSGFSAIPFGAGPVRNVVTKFLGKEDSLRYLMNLKGTNQEIINEAAEMGIQITAAEASDIGTRAIGIQYFLTRQPHIESVRKFYNTRAARTREAVEVLATSFGSLRSQYGDIGTRIANSSKHAIDELASRRRSRATKLYDGIRDAPEPVLVDTTPIIKNIDDQLANPELDPDVVESLTQFKKLLFDSDDNQIQNMMSLHDRRVGSIENLIKANIGTDQGNRLISLRQDLTHLFDAADDTYALARRVYDPTKPALQMVERSVIGKLSRIMSNQQSARALSNLFDPNLSVQSLRTSKRVLRAVDEEAFLDAKKLFITTKLDDMMRETVDMGLPQFQKYFAGSRVKKLMQEMLEPEEYQSFSRMIEIIGKAMSVPKGGAVTQPLLAIERALREDAAGLGSKAVGIVLAGIRAPGRFLAGTIGDDLTQRIATRQLDSYYQSLADALFDPDAAINFEKAYQYFDPWEYSVKQNMFLRGPAALAGAIAPGEDELEYQPTDEQRELIQQQLIEQQGNLENTQGALNLPLFEDIQPGGSFGPMAGGFDPSMSPTILPSASDREIAMRRNAQRSGIGSLV